MARRCVERRIRAGRSRPRRDGCPLRCEGEGRRVRPVVISRRARADLRSIADHIAADNPSRAVSFVAELRERCRSLSETPMQGRPAPEIAPDVRILVFRSYLILHRLRDDAVLIDRVLHSARDRSGLPPNE
ncbi:type II toxin-antitoxin system RelE/ParE family toxin [Methylorubrum podarium]|uniref:type II toxin-antitoxin system RelE/ParE family toxin n=1 Tax=Methylorubrum podarium TaxID=200476 RepID=UPI002795D7AB|nr:type II toxin-antitoxin system RelE/ParE family toxin [Methylorubrum podarium]